MTKREKELTSALVASLLDKQLVVVSFLRMKLLQRGGNFILQQLFVR
jgi:hypothetical protein